MALPVILVADTMPGGADFDFLVKLIAFFFFGVRPPTESNLKDPCLFETGIFSRRVDLPAAASRNPRCAKPEGRPTVAHRPRPPLAYLKVHHG